MDCVQLTPEGHSGSILTNMSQDRLIKMVSKGDDKGVGKGHVYYTVYNNKNKKDPGAKHTERKFNPVSRSHTQYVQKK